MIVFRDRELVRDLAASGGLKKSSIEHLCAQWQVQSILEELPNANQHAADLHFLRRWIVDLAAKSIPEAIYMPAADSRYYLQSFFAAMRKWRMRPSLAAMAFALVRLVYFLFTPRSIREMVRARRHLRGAPIPCAEVLPLLVTTNHA